MLGLIHLAVGTVHIQLAPREYWSSAAGGVAVAYIFVYLLPALEARTGASEATGIPVAVDVGYALCLAALLGFVAFYGVERIARATHDSDQE